jgi:hypothetical protein
MLSFFCRQARPASSARNCRNTFRPRLEALEDRWMPSILTVLNTADSGPNSLRAEIAQARSGDTIAFDPTLSGQTITLTTGELTINKSLNIQGPGQGQLPVTISGAGVSRVFDVNNTRANVTLTNLAIINGLTVAVPSNLGNLYSGLGGGVLNLGGSLTITDCTLSGNSASRFGGGIYNYYGTLSITGSTLSGNSSGDSGGAISNARGTLTISGSTLSGNSATNYGGGIANTGKATVQNSTLSGNSAGNEGGGIYNIPSATLMIRSSIVCDNFAPLGADLYNLGTLVISKDSTVCVIGP